MKFTKSHSILLLILAIGFFFRIYQVDTLPAILNRDEAALAYNALLLKETGQDEFGRAWPTALESFGDFKLPGYSNLLVLGFTVIGYSDLAVRLPSVLAGTALMLVGFWWGRRLTDSLRMGLFMAILVAVSPIFWFYSRWAFEANVALTLFAAGLGCLVWNRNFNGWQDLLGLGLIWWACLLYNTPLLLIPFIIAVLPLMRGLTNWRDWLGPTIGLLLIFTGIFGQLWSLTSQKSGITIFSDELVWSQSVEYRQQFTGISQKILGSKYVFFAGIMARNTVESFSPSFVVTDGGTHPWHSIDSWGHLYWMVYLSALLGMSLAFFKLLQSIWNVLQTRAWNAPEHWWLLYLTIVSLAPAVITVDAPHATRSLFFFFILLAWCAVFWQSVLEAFPKYSNYILAGALILIFLSTLNYGQKYFIGYAKHQPTSLKPGFEHQLQILEEQHPGEPVAIVDPDGYHYILTAWYLKTDPAIFLSSIVKQLPNQIGFKYGERFDRFHFIGQAVDADPQTEKLVLEWKDTEWQLEETP